MTLAVEANVLDVAAIHPSKGAKYSPNLHAWLTLRRGLLASAAREARAGLAAAESLLQALEARATSTGA